MFVSSVCFLSEFDFFFSLIHSLILDPEDTFVKNAFTEEEMNEIVEKKSGQDPPEIDDNILEYINKFSKVSLYLIGIPLF